MLGKIKGMTEKAYATAIEHNESYSKEALWEILLVLNSYKSTQEENKTLEKNIERTPMAEVTRRTYATVTNKDELLKIAYILSEYGHKILFPGERQTQEEAIGKAAKLLGVNHNTLRNQRDYFDSFTNSHRQGWKAPLSNEQQETFDIMRKLPKENITAIINEILHNPNR